MSNCDDCGEVTIGYRSQLWYACCCLRCYNRRYQQYRRNAQSYERYREYAQVLAETLLHALMNSPLQELWQESNPEQRKQTHQQWTDIITQFCVEFIPLESQNDTVDMRIFKGDLAVVVGLYGIRDPEIIAWFYRRCNRPGRRYRWICRILNKAYTICSEIKQPITVAVIRDVAKYIH